MQIEICHSASAKMHTLSRALVESHRRRRFTGFTLIELLVVLVLLAALTALLLPAYRRAIESSKVSKDFSNLRQLGLAIHVHANEHGYIPGEQWPSLLAPAYVAAWDVFKSPFDQRSPGETNPLSAFRGEAQAHKRIHVDAQPPATKQLYATDHPRPPACAALSASPFRATRTPAKQPGRQHQQHHRAEADIAIGRLSWPKVEMARARKTSRS